MGLLLPQQRWIEEMASHLKSVDPNHMVTIGQEGFYGPGDPAEVVNPGTGWATITGQNFTANHAPAAIDFAAIHLWPDNWEVRHCSFISSVGSNEEGVHVLCGHLYVGY